MHEAARVLALPEPEPFEPEPLDPEPDDEWGDDERVDSSEQTFGCAVAPQPEPEPEPEPPHVRRARLRRDPRVRKAYRAFRADVRRIIADVRRARRRGARRA